MRRVMIKFWQSVPLVAMVTSLLLQPVPVMAQGDDTKEQIEAALKTMESDPCLSQMNTSIKMIALDGIPVTASDPRIRDAAVVFGRCKMLGSEEVIQQTAEFSAKMVGAHLRLAKFNSEEGREHNPNGQSSESQLYSKDLHIAGKQPKSDTQNSGLQTKDLLTAGQKPKSDDEILAKCAEVARKNAKVALQNPFAEGMEKRIEAVKNIHKDCTEMAMDEVGKQMDSFGKDGDRTNPANTRSALQNSGAQGATGQSIERTVLMPDGKRYPKASGENPFKALLDEPPPKEKTLIEKTKEGLSNAYSSMKAKLSGPETATTDEDTRVVDTEPKKSVLQRMRDAIPNPFAPSKSNTVEDDNDSPPPEPKKSWSLTDIIKSKADEVADKIERAGEDDPESEN